jgi:flagellar hook assembly protein FlgD
VEAGYHQATWDGSDGHGKAASSGVYLVRMMAGDHQFTRKAILLK